MIKAGAFLMKFVLRHIHLIRSDSSCLACVGEIVTFTVGDIKMKSQDSVNFLLMARRLNGFLILYNSTPVFCLDSHINFS